MFDFIINISTLSPLIASVTTLIVGGYVIWVDSKSRSHKLFFIYCLLLSIWAYGCFIQSTTTSHNVALFWDKVIYSVASFFPLALLFLVDVFSKKPKSQFAYIVGLFSLISLFMNWFMYFREDVTIAFGVRFVTVPSYGWYLYFSFFLFVFSYVLVRLSLNYVEKKSRRNLFVVLSMVILFFAGSSYFVLILFRFNFVVESLLNFSSSFLLVLYSLITGYLVLKEELFSLNVVISKTISIVTFSLLVLFLYVPLVFSLRNNVGLLILVSFLGTFVLSFYGQDIILKIQTYSEQKFLKGSYSPEIAIKELSSNLLKTQDRWSLLSVASEFLKHTLDLKRVYILFPIFCRRSLEGYMFLDTNSLNDSGLVVSDEDANIQSLSLIKKVFSIDNIPKGEIKGSFINESMSYFIPIHSDNSLQGMLILGNKLNDESFDRKDTSFLDLVMNQLIIFFDRINYQRSFRVANKRIEAESLISQSLMEEAQVLSQQATFANLTKGIAHEIKNPINNMKLQANTIQDDIDQNLFFKNYPYENDILQGRISVGKLAQILNDDKLALELLIELKRLNYVNENGYVSDGFNPDRIDFRLVLSDSFKLFEEKIDVLLRHALIHKSYRDFLVSSNSEYARISRISASMLQYGETGKGITSFAFSEIMSFKDSSLLWAELVEKGYINKSGFLSEGIDPALESFSLDLSPRFKRYESSIRLILKRNPYSMKKRVDINQLITSIIRTCEGRFRKEFIRYTLNLKSEKSIFGSEDAIKQCLLNLIDNSVDALLHKNKIERSLEISTFQLKLHRDDKITTCIEIKDSGIGIKSEFLDKVQDPFFTTKSKSGGRHAGLGMPFVFRTIEGHGGVVDIKSEFKVGTVIRILFS